MGNTQAPQPTGRPGLDPAEAARRLAEHGSNLLPGNTPKSLFAIVRGVLIEPMFLMLLVAGGLYLALGDRAEAAFLLSFVFVVIGITLAQERKTQRALESLRELSAPRALVIRGGEELRIPGREVVVGDLLVLHEGDRIAADATLLDGHLDVNESLLTGEAVPVTKLPGGDGSQLFASTVATKGVGVAEVHAIAGATAVGRIGQALGATVEPVSALQQASRRLIRKLTLGGLLLAAAYTLLGWLWDRHGLLESVLAGIALIMAILPEEIPVILTVFLALGARRLSRHKVLTRRVPAVEALGAITVLAVDKTGTLTQNRMQVAELDLISDTFRHAGAAELPEPFHALVEFAMLATPADPFDPMEKAIQQFGQQWLTNTEHAHADWTPEFAYALSPEILAMTHVFRGDLRDAHLLATKGAPEAVIDLCHLNADDAARILHRVDAMAARGLRVLGVARGEWQSEAWPRSQHDFDFRFLGLVGFVDPPRPEVPAAIAECRGAGVRIIMLTGDHPATARAIAREVGLSDRAEVITGAEMTALDDAALRERLHHVDLCARLQPVQKLRLVQLLRASGDVVAMTGDGVNDAPALKAADVGIAMGERGTDVAREAAALVLLDDSFASIVTALRQGRRIYANITKATRFVFAVHMPIVALALVPTLLHWPVLLMPVHIVLLELLIDPACSIVFEAEPAAEDLMQRPPRPRDASPFARANVAYAVIQGLGFAGILLLGYGLLLGQGLDAVSSRTAVFMALILGLFLLTLASRDVMQALLSWPRARNPWVPRMFGAVTVMLGLVIGVPLFRGVLGLSVLDAVTLITATGMLLATLIWLEGWRRATRHIGSWARAR
jgi:Ca2+-transporting ATPase